MASIDVDIDDILWGMSSSEKQELMDELWDGGIIPTNINEDDIFQGAESTTEMELQQVLKNIWNNRLFIIPSDIELLKNYATKGSYA